MESDPAAKPQGQLSMWTIYAHPRDYPTQYVARRWVVGDGVSLATDDVAIADTLAAVRKKIPSGLYRMDRFDEDDLCIAEVWV